MLITTVLYTLLGTLVELLMKACTFIANEILDESIVTFSADENIFNKFVALIPFGEELNIAELIKGISISLVILLVIIAAIKSFVAPMSGEDPPNLLQVVIRAAFTIIMILAIFGTHFGSSLQFNGILGAIGTAFGEILSNISIKANAIEVEFVFDPNPINYIGYILLLAALVAQVVSAAITILERYMSLGLSIIFGPIMVAMYASPDTKDTTKNWALSILTQFLAIFISMLMWIAFINQANKSFESGSIFELAVAIVILTMVRNSEKILNTFGLRTLSVGDAARSITGGFALATGAYMFGARHIGGMAGKMNVAGNKIAGVGNAYSADHTTISMGKKDGSFYEGGSGVFGGDSSHRYSQQASSLFTSTNFIRSGKNSIAQNRAINEIKAARDSNSNTTAKYFNDSFGYDSKSPISVVGSGPSGVMHYTSAAATDGNAKIQGYEGAISYTSSSGKSELIEHAFIPVGDRPNQIQPGSSIGNIDGQERFIENSGVITDPYSGQSFYRTTTVNPNVDFNDINKINESTSYDKDFVQNEKTVVSETDYPAKN